MYSEIIQVYFTCEAWYYCGLKSVVVGHMSVIVYATCVSVVCALYACPHSSQCTLRPVCIYRIWDLLVKVHVLVIHGYEKEINLMTKALQLVLLWRV